MMQQSGVTVTKRTYTEYKDFRYDVGEYTVYGVTTGHWYVGGSQKYRSLIFPGGTLLLEI